MVREHSLQSRRGPGVRDAWRRPGGAGLALTLVLAWGCSTESAPPAEEVAPPLAVIEAPTETLDVEWLPLEESDVYGISRAILHARVTALEPAHHRSYPYAADLGRYLTAAEAGDDYEDLPLTVVTVEVIEPLRVGTDRSGGDTKPGSTVSIVLLGGRLPDGTDLVPNGQPIPGVGDEAVLFLGGAMRPTGIDDLRGFYSLTGGGRGLVRIEAGRITPDATGPFARHAGLAARDFTASVRDTAALLPVGLPYPRISADAIDFND